MAKFRKFDGRIVRHKYITKPIPTKEQPDAVKIFYLCNQAVEANWKKTDIAKRVNCKNCKKILRGKSNATAKAQHKQDSG